MVSVRAIVVDPGVSGRLSLGEVPAPGPLPGEALVRVAAISLNRGEVRRASTAEAGWRPGWDLAGVVVRAAADGSGPGPGERVVGMLASGAWAEEVAVPTRSLALVPETVSMAQAATLPVAGLTALLALERGGLLLGRRVLITGATGGVGDFAIQLATVAGAQVVAHVRRTEQETVVREAGASHVVTGEDLKAASAHAPYHLILESLGSQVLAQALDMLAKDGTCVSFGTSAGREVTFNASRLYATGGASLYGFILFHELERQSASLGLRRLLDLVAAGRLRPRIEVEAAWTEVAQIASRLTDRQFTGKAVLHVTN